MFFLDFIYADAANRFRAVQAWWQDMTERNYSCAVKPSISALQHDKIKKRTINQQKGTHRILNVPVGKR